MLLRLRPRHSGLGSLFLARGVLVGAYHGRIEHYPVQVEGLQGLKRFFPYAFFGQAAEAFADSIGLAETLGQVGLGTAGAH